jgi:hypothetical protein
LLSQGDQNGLHPRKGKRKEACVFQNQGLLGAGCKRQANFQVTTWYLSADLTPAKARKEADRVAVRLEKEQKITFSQQKVGEEPAPPAPVYAFNAFINDVWMPLCIRDGSHRPATVAMYTNILKVILLQFKEVPIDEITDVRISQHFRWLHNVYCKPDGKPLAKKSIKHHYNMLNLIFGFAEVS